MKILVLSDSHSTLNFMRMAISAVKPQAVVHLGDMYQDAQVLQEENPQLRVHMVPGNCDQFYIRPADPAVLCYAVCGVRLFMTHGHLHGVKSGTLRLVKDAREASAQAALYGHTHCAQCVQLEDGMWLLNPGAANYGGSVGLIETESDTIKSCRILRQEDLEALQ